MIELIEKAYNSYLTESIKDRCRRKLSNHLRRSGSPFLILGSKRQIETFHKQTAYRHTGVTVHLPLESGLGMLLEFADVSRAKLALVLSDDREDPRLGVHSVGPEHLLYVLQPIPGILNGSVYRSTSGQVPGSPGFDRSYIIASSRRTGSTMLCHLLEQTGKLGFPEEYMSRDQLCLFKNGELQPERYLSDVFAWNTTPNGVFGVKSHWQSFSSFQSEFISTLSPDTRALCRNLIENSVYVHLRRRDKIRQAISDWRASATGVYHLHCDDGEEVKRRSASLPEYSYQAILKHLKESLLDDRGWLEYFESRQVERLEIFYEDLVEDPGSAVKQLCRYLSVECPDSVPKPVTLPLADQFTEEVFARFRDDLCRDYNPAVLQEVSPEHSHGCSPQLQPAEKKDATAVLVTLATADYLDKAKAFFASAYLNGAWDGDFLLLAHEVEESELGWFRDRGIVVKTCRSLYSRDVGGMHPSLTSKYHLFTPYFRRWRTVVYSDLDAIVRAPLQRLKQVQGFAAVDDWSPSLHEQMVNEQDIKSRTLDRNLVNRLKQQAAAQYRLADRPFCAGFFVFSSDIIEEDTREQLVSLTDQYETVSKFGDQLALNFYFYGRWTKLNPTYNILVRQKSVQPFLDNLYEVETRWGKVEGLHPYILHIFDPKPWSAESGFYLEWLSNLRQADDINFSTVLPPSTDKLRAVQSTEAKIRFRQRVYDFLEGLGEAKLPVIKTIHFWHWRMIVVWRLLRTVLSRIRNPDGSFT